MPRSKAACVNLYDFIRLRLGKEISDREIARRWEMDWKSFTALKHDRRQVPRINELVTLAKILEVDAAFVFEVARGVSARKVHKLLQENDRDDLAQLLMAGIHDARLDAEATDQHFQAVLDRVYDGVFTVDIQGRFQDVNQRLCEITGYTRDELLALSLFDLLAPDQTSRVMTALASVYGGGSSSNVELDARTKSGAEIIVELSATRIDDTAGDSVGVQGIARDVTERNMAQRKHEALLEAVPDLIFQISRDYRYLDFVPAKGTEPFVQPREFLGKKISEVLPGEVSRNCERHIAEAFATQAIQIYEYELPLPDGPHQYEARVVVSGKDEVMAIARDITERKRAEHELRQNEERYRALAEAAKDVIFRIGPDLCLQYVNHAGASWFKGGRRRLVGKPLSKLFPPEIYERQASNIQKVLDTGESVMAEFEYPFPTGSRWLSAQLVPIRDEHGNVESVLGISRDVTERIQAEGEFKKQHATLKTMVDATPAACILFAKDGTIVLANPLVENVCEYTHDEIVGCNASDVFGNPGPDGCPVTRAFMTGKVEQQISRVQNKRGCEVYAHRTAGPVLNGKGEVEQVVEILVDVTEQLQRGDTNLLALWRGEPLPPELEEIKDVEKRRYVRAPVHLPAGVEREGKWIQATAKNLARGGLYLQSAHPGDVLPEGSPVTIELVLGDQKALEIKGVIAWSQRGDEETPAGMGVHFVELADDPQRRIVDYVKQAQSAVRSRA